MIRLRRSEQVAFAFPVRTCSPLEVSARHHELCQHTPEDVAVLVIEYRRYADDIGRDAPLSVPGTGLEYLGCGSDKVVYLMACRRHVLKLGRVDTRFGDQTRREIEIWEASEWYPEYRAILCPVDAYGDGWIVARRADQSDSIKARDALIKAMGYGLPDMQAANCGHVGRRPVMLDYGIWRGEPFGEDGDDDDQDDDSDDDGRCHCPACEDARRGIS